MTYKIHIYIYISNLRYDDLLESEKHLFGDIGHLDLKVLGAITGV